MPIPFLISMVLSEKTRLKLSCLQYAVVGAIEAVFCLAVTMTAWLCGSLLLFLLCSLILNLCHPCLSSLIVFHVTNLHFNCWAFQINLFPKKVLPNFMVWWSGFGVVWVFLGFFFVGGGRSSVGGSPCSETSVFHIQLRGRHYRYNSYDIIQNV